uniref:G-protein coupled receptors family 1 profile domain-containing protein n=1 Tax=Latimeria chalumnae TaxID=7897 RepID=H3AVA8_LATCH
MVSVVANCVVLGCTFLAGIAGNTWVCWIVYRKKFLRTSNNALLVNLAVSDLLKSLVDTPLLLVTVVLGYKRHNLGRALCDLQFCAYSLGNCAQLFTLVTISVERYQAIAHPFENKKRKKRVQLWVLFSWALGLIISILGFIFAKTTPAYLRCRGRAISTPIHSNDFGVFILVPVWLACLALIITYYSRIFVVVRQHTNKIFDKGTTTLPAAPGSDHQGVKSRKGQLSGALSAPAADQGLSFKGADSTAAASAQPAGESSLAPPPELAGGVCVLNPANRERAKKRLESKLAKRSGYIILTFLAFWMPLIIVTLLKNMYPTCVRGGWEVETFAITMTCVTAAINPIIYAVVNPQFQSEFQSLRTRVFPTCCGKK